MTGMKHSGFHRQTPVVINGQSIVPIEVSGQRVVTFAMIDRVHGRPDGTASRNFRENRHRLIEGEDFQELTADEIRRQSLSDAFPPRTPKGIVLTEAGYLMLVKSFTDDLAWQVQRQLVRAYFTLPPMVAIPKIGVAVAREARLTLAYMNRLAEAAGLTGNQAILSACIGTEMLVGVNPLGAMGITSLTAPQNEALLIPSDIGSRVGLTSRKVNTLLCEMGLQTSQRDHKNHIFYEPTEAGIEAGAIMQDTGKKYGNGTPVRQLKWASSIVERIQADL